jgi:hypothetical protein
MKADVCTPQVTLYTDFKEEHSKLSFEAMKKEVAANLAMTGLQLQWRSLSQPESTSGELVVVTFTGKCRMNDLLLPHSESGPLGWTYIEDGHTSPFSKVDCDRIREFINPLVAGAGRDDREALLGRALGRVLVHELCHVFSDSRGHASRGLRKAFFTAPYLLLGHPRLDEKDVNTLRQGKLRRLFERKQRAQVLPSSCQ